MEGTVERIFVGDRYGDVPLGLQLVRWANGVQRKQWYTTYGQWCSRSRTSYEILGVGQGVLFM
jgi:hypothetical protein